MPDPVRPSRRLDPSADRSVSQIYGVLRSEIRAGRLTGDDALSEYRLIPQFKATRNAVRSALKMLAAEGIVRRSPRSGTHVVHVPVRVNADDDMPDLSLVDADRMSIESIQARLIPSPPWALDRLGATTERMIRLEQLVSLDGSPIIWRVAFLIPPIDDPRGEAFISSIAHASGSALPLAANFAILFNSEMGPTDSTIEAVACDTATSQALDLEVGAPVLLRELLFHTLDGTAVAVGFQYCRGDRVAVSSSF